jgi:hypothetical protein
MKRIACLWLVMTLCLAVPISWAQATAQISGSVRDQSGAVLPGVEITATHTETGIQRTTVTNETGAFSLPNLAIGPYRIEASLPGFRSFVQTGIVLQVNSNPVINAVLEVGQVTEQVEVQANASLVETRTQGVGQVIENQRILELPLNGRNVTELISLAGGATPAPITRGSRSFQRGEGVSIAGGLGTGVAYFLDGAVHNNPQSGGNYSIPFPDALQEFKVETSALSAQHGLHSAGAVTVVTKSGTNDFHGNLFEFVRNGKFNARNAFAVRNDSLKRNQFGGTIGGPIRQNRVFFFAGYQGTTIRQDPSATQSFVPTAAMLQGDFTAITSPACNNGRQIALRAPFVNNRIDPSQFSRAALNVINLADFPKPVNECGLVRWGTPVKTNEHLAVGKIDYQWSANHSMFGRYLADSSVETRPYLLTRNLLNTANVVNDALAQAFTLGDTLLIGPNMVNALRLTANRIKLLADGADFADWPQMGVRAYTYYPKRLNASVSGGFTLAGIDNGGSSSNVTFALNDDISLVRGSHQWAFGFSGGYFSNFNATTGLPMGNATFDGSVTGLGLADYLTGNLVTWQQSAPYYHDEHKWYYGAYIADTWKATPRLTANYGLRWEPYLATVFDDGTAYHADLDSILSGKRTPQFRSAPPGLFYPGDPGFPGRSVHNNKWRLFSPRVGLAWDARGDGRTSVRASFGMFTDFIPLTFHQGTNIAPPFSPRVVLNNVKLDDPWANYPGGNPYPTPRGGADFGEKAIFPVRGVYAALPYDINSPQSTQWNLSLQQQLGSDWLFSANYLGSTTIHLWTIKPLNYSVFLPGASCVLGGRTYSPCSSTANTDQRRVISLANPEVGEFFGPLNEVDDGATASYNGMILSVQRRPTQGISLSANYTWSHCIADMTFATINIGTGNGAYTNPFNRRADRGDCIATGSDRRHLFNFTSVAETPQFSNSTLRALATGWRLSPIVRISSGAPLTLTSGTDVALNSIGNQRVDQIAANVYLKDGNRYLNPAAVARPATGTLGNMGVGTVRGPLTWQLDAALSRTFVVTESQRVEFRAEAFNLTNSYRPNNPVTALNNSQFGLINAALDPRIMQFALKYSF